jgi:hypothetical protein
MLGIRKTFRSQAQTLHVTVPTILGFVKNKMRLHRGVVTAAQTHAGNYPAEQPTGEAILKHGARGGRRGSISCSADGRAVVARSV